MKKNDVLRMARQHFESASKAEQDNRALALDDINFVDGMQWSDDAEKARENRPRLTVNRMPSFIDQIIGDARQNQVSVKVLPIDNDADLVTAKVLEGLIRNIEHISNAQSTYISAFENAVTSGFGYFRIITDYSDNEGFDQEILIERIADPFTVYFDPGAQKPDMSDAKFCFISKTICRKEFRRLYPKAVPIDFDQLSTGDGYEKWFYEETVRIAEYFLKERQPSYKILILKQETPLETIDQMTGVVVQVTPYDGIIVKDTEITPELQSLLDDGVVSIAKTRVVEPEKIIYRKMAGNEILEETDWMGTYIPVVPVYGKELNVQGDKRLRGIVRHAKDPQRIYNYTRSTIVEILALQPKVPFLVEVRQVAGLESKWRDANLKNYPYLPYHSMDGNNQAITAPAPHRPDPMQPSPALFNEAAINIDDMKATTNLYDASLGKESNETSGKAILARQRKGETANFAYFDNLQRAINYCGRILVDLIPRIYDAQRTIRILGVDSEPQVVQLYQMGILKGMGEDGADVEAEIDLQVGKYDVAATVGASYTTKRLEASEGMMQFIQAVPQIAPLIMDLIAKYQDWPGSEEIVERLKQFNQLGAPGDAQAVEGKAPPNY